MVYTVSCPRDPAALCVGEAPGVDDFPTVVELVENPGVRGVNCKSLVSLTAPYSGDHF